MNRPPYESLNQAGLPYVREAQTVDELPTEAKQMALESATLAIAKLLQMKAIRKVGFGTPVFVAFGMNRNQAKMHAHAKLLLTMGCDLSLDLCPEYAAASLP